MRRPRRVRLVLAGLAAAGLLAAAMYTWMNPLSTRYIVETRRYLLTLKTDGHAPGVGWLALARRMGPRWMQPDTPTFVTAIAEGPEPCPVLWRTPLGSFWGGHKDGRVLDHLVMEELGGHIYNRGAASIRPGDVVMDVGAHLGTFARYALRHGASRIIAVEPMPALVSCLERTFANEIEAGTLTIAPVAAWNVNTELEFQAGTESTMGHVESAGNLRVKAETLDSVAERLGASRIDFIKMDIEGAEPQALAGAQSILRAHHPRMAICIYHAPTDAETVPAAVLAANPRYQVFYRGPFQAYFHP